MWQELSENKSDGGEIDDFSDGIADEFRHKIIFICYSHIVV